MVAEVFPTVDGDILSVGGGAGFVGGVGWVRKIEWSLKEERRVG